MSSVTICKGDISLYQQIIASSAGALITSLMVTPMDVVKIRLQSQVHPIAKGDCFLFHNGLMDHLCVNCADVKSKAPCEWFNRPGHFKGTLDAFAKIARYEGVQSLWSGLSPTIVSAIPATVFYFSVYDNLLCHVKKTYGDHFLVPLAVGAIARSTAVTVVSPIEMVRTKMQSQVFSYTQLRNAIATTIRHEGYMALWKGLAATMLRDIPFSAIYWTGFEFLKKKMLLYFNRLDTNFMISFTCGATSGMVAAVVTLPFDVVKTHRQITLGRVQETGAPLPVTSTFRIMSEISKTRGYTALFAGLIPRVAKVAPACAIMIASYDYLKHFFYNRNKQKRDRQI